VLVRYRIIYTILKYTSISLFPIFITVLNTIDRLFFNFKARCYGAGLPLLPQVYPSQMGRTNELVSDSRQDGDSLQKQTGSFYWVHPSMFHLQNETVPSLRKVMFLNKTQNNG
jgi:hypothetical protein